jgi:ubiquinone/menaquinone biosynthesis C-methylase UbiE
MATDFNGGTKAALPDESMHEGEYVLGYNSFEFQRLERQASILAPLTSDFLCRAGLARGMRVLDVGCGVGDVSILAADLVGSSGLVVGVDRSTEAIAIAEKRVAISHPSGTVRFVVSELDAMDIDMRFDAVIGRLVLMYQPDPVAALRRLRQAFLGPNGIVAFQEVSLPMARSVPEGALFRRMVNSVSEVYRRAKVDFDMGAKLARVFTDSGLPWPTMVVGVDVVNGHERYVHEWFADIARSLSPAAKRFGVSIAELTEFDTLAERMRAEAVELQACIIPPAFFGAWARTQ